MDIETKIMIKAQAYTFFILLSFFSLAQCVEVTPGTYSGETKNGSLDRYGSGSFSINTSENSNLILEDFSAGFFAQFNKTPIEITVQIDCNGQVSPKEVESIFGMIYIDSGTYDTNLSQLTLIWRIPHNQVNEKSIFTKN